MKKYLYVISIAAVMLLVITISIATNLKNENVVQTVSSGLEELSNKKIGWGIKRSDNYDQPDIGTTNRKILDKYEGIYMGNNEKKYIYVTFDLGYEAGYTPKILEVLKQNDVKATFFITAHYVNTQPDLVKQMIDEGHIIGNHTVKSLMSSDLNTNNFISNL